MFDFASIPVQALLGQLLVGLINGSFYALLSLGLAIIFGVLRIVNFAHGALYMLGALGAWLLLNLTGINYWGAVLLAPVAVGLVGALIEYVLLRPIRHMDHIYGLLVTFGVALLLEGTFSDIYGVAGLPYAVPAQLSGGVNLGFMFLPWYRAWVLGASICVCVATWLLIERTKLGSYLRASTENPKLAQALGLNVPLLITVTYGFGASLAGLAGVMAAPIYQVSPTMGASALIVVFAVVVIGGMGSLMGATIAGFALGLIEGCTRLLYPEASSAIIFIIMVLVLLLRPAGLLGREA